MKNIFTIASFGIIFDQQNKILLCHRRDYDLWNLPGGTMEVGESPWECVVREIKEETGLNVEIKKLIGVYNKPEKNEICFSFMCSIINGELTLNEEADKLEYFAIKDIPANMSLKQIERIKDALSLNGDNVTLKNQRGKSSIELIKEQGV